MQFAGFIQGVFISQLLEISLGRQVSLLRFVANPHQIIHCVVATGPFQRPILLHHKLVGRCAAQLEAQGVEEALLGHF